MTVIEMGCKSFERQLAEALGKENVNTSDFMGVVENDTLFRVSVGSFITSMGFTGALTSVAPFGDISLLGGDAPKYEIRGLRAGAGMTIQRNPQGSVTVASNVGNAGGNNDGERLIQQTNANRILFKRLRGGNGIRLTSTNSSIEIALDTESAETFTQTPHALTALETPTLTPIATQGLFTRVQGNFATLEANLFNVSPDGAVIYTDLFRRFFSVDITIRLAPATGPAKDLAVQIAKNGVLQPFAVFSKRTAANDINTLTLTWGVTLETGDNLSVFIANNTDTTDIQVSQLLIRAS